MPYEVKRGSGCPPSKPWGVYGPDGKRMGCHETEDKAKSQIAAIEANEERRT